MKNTILRIKLLILICLAVVQKTECQQICYGEVLLDSLDNLEKYPGDEVMLEVIQNAIPRILKEDDLPSYYTCILTLCSMYYNLDKNDLWGETIELALELASDTLNFPQQYMGSILNNLAVYQSSKGNYKQAIATYIRSIEEEKRTQNDPYEIPVIYDNINNTYNTLGDYKKCIEYSKRSLELKRNSTSKYYKKNPNFRHFPLAISYYNIGHAHLKMHDYKNAESNIKSCLKELLLYQPKKDPTKKNKKLISTYHKLADIYYQMNYPDLMINNLEKAQVLQKELDYKKYKNLELFGIYYLLKGDYKQSEKLLLEALKTSKDRYANNKESPIPAKILNHLGDLKLKQNEHLEAINYYHQGLQYIDYTLNDTLINNTALEHIQASSQALELLQKKASISYELYQNNKKTNSDFLDVSYNSYLSVARLLDQMRSNFLSETSKFYVAESATPIYEDGIEVLFEYFNTKRSNDAINDILEYMEFSKSSILFESLQNKIELATSKIPQSVLNKELDITVDLSYYQKKLSQELLKGENQSKEDIELFEKTIFDLNEKFAILREEMKSDYPKYYNLKKYESIDNKLSTVQDKIDNKQLLLEYFVTAKDIYFIAISKDKATFHKSSKSNILDTVKTFYSEISKKPSIEKPNNLHFDSGSVLYKELMELAIKTHSLKSEIIIIPDNILNKIPFDCFYKYDSNNKFYPVIKDYTISYLYSINQLNKNGNRKSNHKVLCMAPIFETNPTESEANRDCLDEKLQNLPYAQEELNFLSDNFEGKFLSGEQAKSEEFLSSIKHHSVIHLATHGCLNPQNPMLSEIYFQDQALTNYEIENLNVQPEMVVLSACNTASGALQKGEGVISLSRGFFEAGVKSLQSSLWSIDDFTSSGIMKSMYTNLKAGESKSEALRLAKLEHLEEEDKLRKHPYFWAAMIHIGNPEPIFTSTNFLFHGILTGLGLVILLYFLFKSK